MFFFLVNLFLCGREVSKGEVIRREVHSIVFSGSLGQTVSNSEKKQKHIRIHPYFKLGRDFFFIFFLKVGARDIPLWTFFFFFFFPHLGPFFFVPPPPQKIKEDLKVNLSNNFEYSWTKDWEGGGEGVRYNDSDMKVVHREGGFLKNRLTINASINHKVLYAS